jgi:hypothetical protein
LFPLLDGGKQTFFLFFAGCAALVALAGIAIPSSVIVSSPEEFSFIDSYQSPLPFVFNTFAKSFGLLLVWPACVYFLFGKKIKSLLGLVFAVLSLFALVNCFIFQGNYTTISNTFKFNSIGGLNTSALLSLLNVLCAAFIFIILAVLIKYQRTWIINSGLSLVLFSLILFSGYNVFFIHKSFKNLLALKKTSRTDIRGIQPIFSFAKDKPNIMVIMSDCAISGFVKPIFDEHPVLYTQFDGFTLFPNTLSFAKHTLMGVPSVWGGYEYTPEEMNRRNAVSMVDKHNEALLLIPTVLSGLGYHITVTDPSWANYDSINDTSIYDRLENVTALNTIGRYTNLWYSMTGFTQAPVTSGKINRNALWFSFLKCAPPYLRKLIYDDGWYWGTDEYVESITTFLNSYAVLDFLPGLTVYDSESPSALLITNEATHDLFFLQYPSYTPVEAVTDTGKGEFSDSKNYHVNSAFYLKTGEWFDELRKNGVYDNTRIIIVSDHGSNINAKIADTDIAIQDERREGYNPVLLVKDFNSHGALRTDMAFMTNADVPFLTLDGIADTVNPFTGKSLKENPKNEGVYITTNHLPQAYSHNKYTFKINYNQWLHVRDTIFEAENWVYKNPFDRQAEEKK